VIVPSAAILSIGGVVVAGLIVVIIIGIRNALSFPGELQKLTCRQSSILVDAMRYLPPLTSLSEL
jgi:hypothetical protein